VTLIPGSGRREARERALELLYEAESKGATLAAVVADLPIPPDPYASAIALGVGEDLAQVDSLISERARGWRLSRMPAIDRSLLRIAVWELVHRPDIPVAVIINEAVELAKQYSTEESGRFVNGVLSRVARDVRPDED
jgi:transcription antitermination protein NusB